jgi:hypothetical protein
VDGECDIECNIDCDWSDFNIGDGDSNMLVVATTACLLSL